MNNRNKMLLEAVTEVVGDPLMAKRVAFTVAKMEAADGKGDSYETVKDLAMWLLGESNALNVVHWNVDKMAKHTLLQEAYELCRDTGDKLAETYIAITKQAIKGTVPEAAEIGVDDESVMKCLENRQTRIQEAVSKNDKFSEGLKNIFADFDENITTIIYKYRQFES